MYRKCVKRMLDIILSLMAIILLSPVLLILAILVRFKLGKPVIFKQQRPGKNEKIFTLYKFRTMTDEKDENGKLLEDEKRLTKFGKKLRATSLDELPELFNILKGDMSIVGPRPLLISYLPYYTQEERHRHDVRPGLTGLAQIHGRNNATWEERFKYDLEYIENISLKNDLKIVLKTIKKVIIRENVLSGKEQTILENLSEERKPQIRRLYYKDIIQNEDVIKKYIKELRKEHFNGSLDNEIERIFGHMKQFTEDNTAIILGLFILSELKGFLWGYYIDENIAHINYFIIAREYRRFGFGKSLITEFKKCVPSNVELLVNKSNEEGIMFYRNNGFKMIEEDDNAVKLCFIRSKNI